MRIGTQISRVSRLGIFTFFLVVLSCANSANNRSGRTQYYKALERPKATYERAPKKSPPPSVIGGSVVVMDADRGWILCRKNADQKRPVASTQKLLTALILLENQPLNKWITIAKTDMNAPPSKLYLRAGERYQMKALLEALLIKSSNDVARALARDFAGSQTSFASIMNRRARQLGMRSSSFITSNGLHKEGQYSTARDMATLAYRAWRNSFIRQTVRKKNIAFRFNGSRGTRTYKNTNKLLLQSPWCNGMKTGYTRKSGRCLISSGTRKGRSVIVVVLGSTTQSIWEDSRKLLHWGLEQVQSRNRNSL